MADDMGDEVPEADAFEQRQSLDDEPDGQPSGDSMEVPDVDAFEQSQDAGDDDGYDHD